MPRPSQQQAGTPASIAQRLQAFFAVAVLALLAGCSPYKFAGDQLMRLGEKVIVPHELAGDDLGIGCRAATAFLPPTIAFQGVGTDVDHVAVLLLLTSGVCIERENLENELAFLRAMHRQDPTPGQDARIVQKRGHLLAAKREFAAYRRFIRQYGVPREGHCPGFRDDFDELVFMVGLLAGVQAMINDAAAGGIIQVPRDIAPNVAHMVNCLHGEKWWNLPNGVRAALWYTAPMFAPEGADPAKMMADVAQQGGREGVRLGHVIWAMTTYNGGDYATTRRAIREFVEAGKQYPPNPRYHILDNIAGELILAVSDRIWSEQAGYRTPMGALGTFPDDPPANVPAVDPALLGDDTPAAAIPAAPVTAPQGFSE